MKKMKGQDDFGVSGWLGLIIKLIMSGFLIVIIFYVITLFTTTPQGPSLYT